MTAADKRPNGSGDALRGIMSRNALTNRDMSQILCVSIKTVESWLADPGSANFRNMPSRHFAILSIALPVFLGKRRTAAKAAKKG